MGLSVINPFLNAIYITKPTTKLKNKSILIIDFILDGVVFDFTETILQIINENIVVGSNSTIRAELSIAS